MELYGQIRPMREIATFPLGAGCGSGRALPALLMVIILYRLGFVEPHQWPDYHRLCLCRGAQAIDGLSCTIPRLIHSDRLPIAQQGDACELCRRYASRMDHKVGFSSSGRSSRQGGPAAGLFRSLSGHGDWSVRSGWPI